MLAPVLCRRRKSPPILVVVGVIVVEIMGACTLQPDSVEPAGVLWLLRLRIQEIKAFVAEDLV